MVIWQYAGYSMVIFLAGLEGVPQELHEAAMDRRRRHWSRGSATSPGRCWRPALTINLMLSTIGGLKLFDQVVRRDQRRPRLRRRETLSTVLYKEAFVYGKFGYSTAVALVLALFVAAVSLVQTPLSARPGGDRVSTVTAGESNRAEPSQRATPGYGVTSSNSS